MSKSYKELKSELEKVIRDEVFGVKESLKQDMDRRNEHLSNKVALEISSSFKEFMRDEIKPLKKVVYRTNKVVAFATFSFVGLIGFFSWLGVNKTVDFIKAVFL